MENRTDGIPQGSQVRVLLTEKNLNIMPSALIKTRKKEANGMMAMSNEEFINLNGNLLTYCPSESKLRV